MTHDEVYTQFKKHLSSYAGQVKEWFPNGYNSVRVRFKDDRDYIFTVLGNGVSFETKEHFIKRLTEGSD